MDVILKNINTKRAQYNQPLFSHQDLILQAMILHFGTDKTKIAALYESIDVEQHVNTYFIESMLFPPINVNEFIIVYDTCPQSYYRVYTKQNITLFIMDISQTNVTQMWQIVNFNLPFKLFTVIPVTAKHHPAINNAILYPLYTNDILCVFNDKICKSYQDYKKKITALKLPPYSSHKVPFVYAHNNALHPLLNI